MTVAELIDKLKDMPQDYKVVYDDFGLDVRKIKLIDKFKLVKIN